MMVPKGRNQNESLQNDLFQLKPTRFLIKNKTTNYTDMEKVGNMKKEKGMVLMEG